MRVDTARHAALVLSVEPGCVGLAAEISTVLVQHSTCKAVACTVQSPIDTQSSPAADLPTTAVR